MTTDAPGAPGPTLLDVHDALLLDLDGVVYVGPHPVRHAVDALHAAGAAGVTTAYVTNNAARPASVVAEHLRSFGLEVAEHGVVTSAQAGAREVAARVAAGSRVLAVGGPGVAQSLQARGLVPVTSAADAPVAVLMGYGPDVSWRELAEASYAVGAGALLVATNLDLSIPTDRGIAPGNGTLVGAVVAATGIAPAVVAGKPFEPLVRESIERVGALRPLMVGDRLDTDIEAGHRSGIPSLLVLTGVTGVAALLAAPPIRRPTFIAADLRGLALPLATVSVAVPPGAPGSDDGLARLRAACRAAWSAADAGAPRPPVDEASLLSDVATALGR
ncbi:HAD-IIA family hydrolase [Longivirga aurantiaca]|uniref:HAD-IIA family hydrolase n=1 Tax=Longivirga aurantiaca TaxID=1837743 RepID=A0ABW1T292_9ACTN